jgi:hypothetical protein
VLVDGKPLAYLERGGKSLALFDGAVEDTSWVDALAGLVKVTRQVKSIEIQKIDGKPTAEVPELRDLLLNGGFAVGYKGPTLRR